MVAAHGVRQRAGAQHRVVHRIDGAQCHGPIGVTLSLRAVAQYGVGKGVRIRTLRIIRIDRQGPFDPRKTVGKSVGQPELPAKNEIGEWIGRIELERPLGRAVRRDCFGLTVRDVAHEGVLETRERKPGMGACEVRVTSDRLTE